MIDAAAKQMADQFFGAFQAHLAPVDPGASAPADQVNALAAHAPHAPHAPDAPVQQPAPAQAPAQPAAAQPPSAARSHSAVDQAASEWLRIKWFALGALATALGVWIGARL
jgi:hypothetical protein